MKRYRALERFYKRGDFYGMNPEAHVHALPSENACVVNLFNLSDQPRTITGEIPLKQMHLDSARAYRSDSAWARVENGTLRMSLETPPWSAEVAEVRPAGP